MKIRTCLILSLFILLVVSASVVYAYVANYSLSWWTVDAGGGTSSNDPYSLSGTIGQADTRYLRGGDYVLAGGFWGGGWLAIEQFYLPIIRR